MALSACLGACGDNSAGPAAIVPDAGPFQTAPHVPMPIVYPHTGTVLSSMRLVTVTYAGYPAAADVAEFGDALVGSAWYGPIGVEYGITGASHIQHVSLGAPPASLNRDQVAQEIRQLATADPEILKPGGADNLLYLLYVPPGVVRGPGLIARPGYHDMVTLDGVRIAYAVVLDDDGDLLATTRRAAHQVINAATNPYVPPKDGYYADPPKTDPWHLLQRREIADLCEGEEVVMEGRFAFPRIYSNIAAAAGMPPCWPQLPGDSWADVTAEPSQIQMVRAGGLVSFKLTGWSTSPVPDWKLRLDVAESSNLSADEMQPDLSSDTINNNVSVTLTLRVPLEASSGATGGVEVLSGASGHPWAVGFIVR